MRLGDPYYDAFRQLDEVWRATREFDEIRRATREVDEIRRVTRQFEDVCRATQSHETLGQITRPYDELQQAAQSWDSMRKLTNPASEVARAIESADLCKSFANAQSEAIEAASSMASSLVLASEPSFRKLLEAPRECWNLASFPGEIQKALEAWQVNVAGTLDYRAWDWIAPYAASLISTERLIIDSLGTDYNRVMGFKLAELVSPTLDAYSAWTLPEYTGLLTGTSEASLLTWPTMPGRRSSTPPLTCAFMRHASQDEQASHIVEIHCQVDCGFCGQPLIEDGEDRSVDAEGRVIINLRVLPLCSTCLKLNNQDPNYFMRQLERVQGGAATQPRLRLIRGSSRATSSPRGKEILRLIKADEDGE